jgi:hypothetical protein
MMTKSKIGKSIIMHQWKLLINTKKNTIKQYKKCQWSITGNYWLSRYGICIYIYIYIYLYDYCAWIVNKQQQTNTLLSIKTENSSLICYNDWCDCSNYQTLK